MGHQDGIDAPGELDVVEAVGAPAGERLTDDLPRRGAGYGLGELSGHLGEPGLEARPDILGDCHTLRRRRCHPARSTAPNRPKGILPRAGACHWTPPANFCERPDS